MLKVGKMINYKKLGLKAGLEVHQQLDTRHKLFCNCSTQMREKEPIMVVKRRQHPVASELGEIDVAAQYEFLRDRTFHYQVFSNETCLVELDEEPPHPLNQEALHIAIEIALLFNCQIPNEIQVMRKTVIDGSTPTAFQRTAVVGLNGFLRYKGKKVEIKQISLEEDAAAIVGEENGSITYKLNRVGIPLVEISTDLLTGFTPEDIQDIAFHIGMLCRSTDKVKRGIGTIRQDINVSIGKGARTEIKGVQDLGMLSKIVENEVQKQLSLIDIRNELRKRKSRVFAPVDVSDVLKETRNVILRSIVAGGGSVFAILLPKFSGLLKKELFPGKTLGRELADIAVAFGIKGIFHTDEDLTKTQLIDDFGKVRNLLKAKEDDAIILIGEVRDKGKVANQLIDRYKQLLVGPKEETRAASENGTTRYTRPLPGSARMYPETDIMPVSVKKEIVEGIKRQLPEPWTRKLARFKSKLRLSELLAKEILRSDYLELFEKIVKTKKVGPSIVANTFTSILKDLEKRENVKIENLTESHYTELFDYLAKKRIVKEAIPEILKYLAAKPGETVGSTIKELELTAISMDELKRIIKDVISQPEMSFDKVVGIVMSKIRGRVDAQVVIKTVRKMM